MENKPTDIIYNRISYRKSKVREGWLESCITLTSSTTGAIYRVYLDLENGEYHLKNMRAEALIHMPKDLVIKNRQIICKHAKDHLMRLGVKFEREFRERTFGLCEKGYSQKKHKTKSADTQP